MHGGVKFYSGSAAAARAYVEADHSRADDYYLAEGSGVASRYIASASTPGEPPIQPGGTLDGPAYERWVAGFDVDTGLPRDRRHGEGNALRFVEVVVNGPKTWSLAAALHPEIAAAYDAAQERAATEIIGWLAAHATTRVGPRGRQVQVPVEKLEAAVVRHYTSRAGDPHRHLHLQISARVFAAGQWRGLHSVGVRDDVEAINGIGHAAVMCDPEFRSALAAHGYTLAEDGELRELAPYAGSFSARAAQSNRNIDRYEATWRAENPGREPGPKLRRVWDRRAWSDARPDKVTALDGAELVARWNDELLRLGFTPPTHAVDLAPVAIGRLNRDEVVEVVLSRLGARRSGWNAADIRGEVERIIATAGIVTATRVRHELAEDLTARVRDHCMPLVGRTDAPEHVRGLTSRDVLDVEAGLNRRFSARADQPSCPARLRAGDIHPQLAADLDAGQRDVVAALAGTSGLLVIEGAAGAGKTTTLAAARAIVERQERRFVVVTPTLKAAQAAAQQIGTDAYSAAWLIHQHGYRWDEDGRWARVEAQLNWRARLLPGDVLLVDEAGMLDQDTALALLEIADRAEATVALLGDRHQLPAVGRGGVLDLAARWAKTEAHLELESVHRFKDPRYAVLTLLMRTGERPAEVFDALVERGEIVIHATEVESTAALTAVGGLVIADTREQVSKLNGAIRDRRRDERPDCGAVTTHAGEQISIGDHISTRRNDRDLGVANRDTWTVTGIGDDGSLLVAGRSGQRELPPTYVAEHVELAYATTVYGAQGETVDEAHFQLGESTGAAAAYVAMTRGRDRNVAHLVAESVEDARRQWIDTFSRDRADLGPAHAAEMALEDIERYGPQAPHQSSALQGALLREGVRHPPEPPPVAAAVPGRGIGR